MKPFYALIIIFNLAGYKLLAKQPEVGIDSIQKSIASALRKHFGADTLTINRIDTLAKKYFESYPDSTAYFGNLEIKLSKQINYKKGIANGNTQIATVNTFRGNYDASAKNLNVALNIYRQLNYTHGICESYIRLGSIQDYLGHYDNAIGLFNKALAVCLKSGSEADLSYCYNVMGITYDNKGDLSKALDNYFKSLTIDIKIKNNLKSASKYSNIGVIMKELELYPKALNYYHRALTLWEQLDDWRHISTAYQNIGEALIAQQNYKDALSYLNRARVLVHQLNDSEGISLVYYDMGLYHYYTHHPDSAIYYLNLSLAAPQNTIKYNRANDYLALAMVYNAQKNYHQGYAYAAKAQAIAYKLGSLSIKVDAALQLSAALAGLKQFEQAYYQHELYSNLKSDLKHNESIQKIMLYNLELDFAKKQKELADHQQVKEQKYKQKIATQQNANLVYGALIVILTVLAVVYYRGKRKQQKINTLLAEKNDEVISQQENLNLQAVKLNELNILKDRLIGVLAHDLRAPISTLRGLFNLMTDAGITTEEFIEMTPKVFNKLEHTSDFLDTLLFWINSQVDNTEDRTKSFLIADLVNRELQHLEDKLKQKGITVQVNIHPDAVVLADPNPVRIVIHNFLTNAIKFSKRNGVIEITAGRQDNHVEFCLKDYGIGMSDDYLNSLFKSQVSSAIGTENESGTGMGLLFCKDLIQNQDGKIWAKSTLGAGTELCFSLPVGDSVLV